MNRMFGSLAAIVLTAAFAAPVQAVPTCNGLSATIYVNGGFIVGGPDNGLIYAGTLDGGNGADVIVGTSGNDTVNAGNGNDTICTLGGNDTVYAGNGNDWVDAGDDDDYIAGENGVDTLTGGNGNDTVNGGNGADVCSGGSGSNVLLSCEQTIQTGLIIVTQVNGGTAVPGDFTNRVAGNSAGYMEAMGLGAPGRFFNLNPGYYISDVAWVMGYALDREDYGNPSDCIANPFLANGEQRTCTLTNNFLPMATIGDEASCGASSGWYGEYFNYPHTRADMYNTYAVDPIPSGDGFYGTLRGEPLNPSDDAYEWYNTPEYYRFSRVDPNLYFGEYFWPLYGPLTEEETYGGGRDFHFGVHWSGVVTVPSLGSYGFLGRLADSVYVYVNGALQYSIPGTQSVRFSGALSLASGDVVDIYYANRTSDGSSAFMFRFNDPAVTVAPNNSNCP